MQSPNVVPDNDKFGGQLTNFSPSNRLFGAYYAKTGSPDTIWGQMKSLLKIIVQQGLNDGPTTLLPFPAQYHYKTVAEGVLKGTYGRHINHVVEAKMFEDLCKNKHNVAFYTISADTAIPWSHKVEEIEESPIDERTVFTITCSVRGIEKPLLELGRCPNFWQLA